MEYKRHTQKLLYELGLQKMYKGSEYITSCIDFIAQNETAFTPATKILYIEIAKKYKTSNLCIEKNIRFIINKIWTEQRNPELLQKIFGVTNGKKNPGNLEFLMHLYQYLKIENGDAHSSKYDDYTFICPQSGKACEFCKEFIIEKLNERT